MKFLKFDMFDGKSVVIFEPGYSSNPMKAPKPLMEWLAVEANKKRCFFGSNLRRLKSAFEMGGLGKQPPGIPFTELDGVTSVPLQI